MDPDLKGKGPKKKTTRSLILALIVVIIVCTGVLSLFYYSQKEIILTDDGHSVSITTTKKTVEGFLNYMGVELNDGDEVMPSLNTRLADGDKIVITRAVKAILTVDGDTIEIYTTKQTVEELLKQANIELFEKDKIKPAMDQEIFNNTEIKIVRVNEDFLSETEDIPYQVVKKKNNTMDEGDNKIVQEGKEGVLEKRYLVVYEDGIEVKRELVEEKVTVEPSNRIVEEGTIKTILARGQTVRYHTTMNVNATAYTLRQQETGKAVGHSRYGITASGKRATINRTIAADIGVLPFGTRVYIPYFNNVFVVEDVGGSIKGNKLDIFFGDPLTDPGCVTRASQFGRRNLTVYVLID